MGYSFKGACYTTTTQADAMFCQSFAQSGFNSSGQVVNFNCTAINASTITLTKLVNTTTTTQAITKPAYLPCTYDGGISLSQDYFAKGLAVLAILWVAKYITTLLFGKSDHA